MNNAGNTYHTIIVGQGLAGTLLAWKLMKLGKRVLIISEPGLSSSSLVAAGLWNPIVFKRLSPSWKAETLIPVMKSCYVAIEQDLGVKLMQEKRLMKLFTEEQEKAWWRKKSAGLKHFIQEEVCQKDPLTDLDYAYVTESGYVHVSLLLEKSREYFSQKESYLEEAFEYRRLQVKEAGITYKNLEAGEIVFCEGYKVKDNPWFNYLPFKPAKGEVLTISCEQLNTEEIINKGVFILPMGNHQFKVGATYNWTDLTDNPTNAGREELVAKLEQLIRLPYTILKQEAGVRPSVIDRRPIAGSHPAQQQLKILNGLGTKGVMIGPWLVEKFIAGEESEGWEEITVRRFDHYYREKMKAMNAGA